MRFIFKTSYRQDIRLYRHGGDIFWYGLLILALLKVLVLQLSMSMTVVSMQLFLPFLK